MGVDQAEDSLILLKTTWLKEDTNGIGNCCGLKGYCKGKTVASQPKTTHRKPLTGIERMIMINKQKNC